MKNKKRLIPENCPDCSYTFSFKDKSNHHMQRKAKLIYGLSIILLPLWWGAIYFIAHSLNLKLASIGHIVAVIALIPGLIMATTAYSIPKILSLKCRKCSYENQIFLKSNKRP